MGTKTIRKLRCPDCGAKWTSAVSDALPNFCPQCASDLRVPDPDFVPTRMNIGTSTGKAGDWSYNKLVADSEARAEAALPAIEQQLREAGIPAEQAATMAAKQAAELRVTNMKDNMREGDVAAMPPAPANNIVSQTAEAYREALGFQYFQGGMGVAGAGPAPMNESGGKVLNAIQGGAWRSKAPAPNATVAGMSGGFGKVGRA
jgi:hypothetical protein